MEHKPKIEIKESHKGKFTEWCKRHGHKAVTKGCEEEGLASKMANVRAMAQFAKNSRSWKK